MANKRKVMPKCVKCKNTTGTIWMRKNSKFTRLEKICYCPFCDLFFEIQLNRREVINLK